MWRFPATAVREVKNTVAANFETVFGLIQSHALQVAPLMSHFAHAEQAAEIYEGLQNRRDEFWGAVFNWSKQ